jgi:hypothetical protein
MSLIGKLRTFRATPRDDKLMFVQALILPVIVSCGFRAIGVSRTQGNLRRWATSGNNKTREALPEEIVLSARIAQDRARRWGGFEGTCLVRSLTLWALALRRHVEVDLLVGFRNRDGQIEGHAWVEFQGKPVNESVAVVSNYQVAPAMTSFDDRRFLPRAR